ncbi:MAG: hypothetical protein ACPG9K_00945 [Poseidonibacter sp.]
MIKNPYFITSDKISQYKQDMKTFDWHCTECQKKMYKKKLYCTRCLIRLHSYGFEQERVMLGEVGINTINYQQYLHRKFFGCNANIKYRGNIKSRIKNNINNTTIEEAAYKIKLLLEEKEYTYRSKLNKKHPKLLEIYNNVSSVRNIHKRLVYNLLLYFIDYYILENKSYKSLAHFQASVTTNLFVNIENTHIRLHKGNTLRKIRKHRLVDSGFGFYPYIYERIHSIISKILVEI